MPIIRHRPDILGSEITPQGLYLDRRRFLALAGAAALLPGSASAAKLDGVTRSALSTTEKANSFEEITSYNNYYELGPDKEDPKQYGHLLRTKPWSVMVEGECAKPGTVALEDLIKPHQLEERIYRLRCVEGWSMVIPWVGVPLSAVLSRFEPNSKAKYVAFQTAQRPAEMPGLKLPLLDWPYVEGLRIDEAMHPLTILAVGLYGQELPGQNGAPLRLVVPWKYGFKSIKSITHIRFVEQQPATAWNKAQPSEYGFFANVNPAVDHPRWSQRKERRIGEFLKRETLPFNGYADQVAGLYSGMDLAKFF